MRQKHQTFVLQIFLQNSLAAINIPYLDGNLWKFICYNLNQSMIKKKHHTNLSWSLVFFSLKIWYIRKSWTTLSLSISPFFFEGKNHISSETESESYNLGTRRLVTKVDDLSAKKSFEDTADKRRPFISTQYRVPFLLFLLFLSDA